MVQESLNILQLSMCLRSRKFNMVANVKEATQRIMNQTGEKRQAKLNNNIIVTTSFWSDLRAKFSNYIGLVTMPREGRADCMKYA